MHLTKKLALTVVSAGTVFGFVLAACVAWFLSWSLGQPRLDETLTGLLVEILYQPANFILVASTGAMWALKRPAIIVAGLALAGMNVGLLLEHVCSQTIETALYLLLHGLLMPGIFGLAAGYGLAFLGEKAWNIDQTAANRGH